MHIVDILDIYMIIFISYRSTCVSIFLTLQTITNYKNCLDNSNDYFRLKQLSTGFSFGGTYATLVLTVYMCLFYNIQQQYILFPSYFSIKHAKVNWAFSTV